MNKCYLQPIINKLFNSLLIIGFFTSCSCGTKEIKHDVKYFHLRSNRQDYIVFYEDGTFRHVVNNQNYMKMSKWHREDNKVYLKEFNTIIDPYYNKIDTNQISKYGFLIFSNMISLGEEIEYVIED